MGILFTLTKLQDKIYQFKMKRTDKKSITITEIQERMRSREYIPTNYYNATKTDYIVKARTIHGPKVKKRCLR